MDKTPLAGQLLVHCRVGSLEKDDRHSQADRKVHCRVGSLEIVSCRRTWHPRSSLPGRQLRNVAVAR